MPLVVCVCVPLLPTLHTSFSVRVMSSSSSSSAASSADAASAPSALSVAGWILGSVGSSVGLILVNKVIMKTYGFSFVLTLTALHFLGQTRSRSLSRDTTLTQHTYTRTQQQHPAHAINLLCCYTSPLLPLDLSLCLPVCLSVRSLQCCALLAVWVVGWLAGLVV